MNACSFITVTALSWRWKFPFILQTFPFQRTQSHSFTSETHYYRNDAVLAQAYRYRPVIGVPAEDAVNENYSTPSDQSEWRIGQQCCGILLWDILLVGVIRIWMRHVSLRSGTMCGVCETCRGDVTEAAWYLERWELQACMKEVIERRCSEVALSSSGHVDFTQPGRNSRVRLSLKFSFDYFFWVLSWITLRQCPYR